MQIETRHEVSGAPQPPGQLTKLMLVISKQMIVNDEAKSYSVTYRKSIQTGIYFSSLTVFTCRVMDLSGRFVDSMC